MPKPRNLSTKKVGLAPGTVVFTGQQRLDEAVVRKIAYGSDIELVEVDVDAPESLSRPAPSESGAVWINVHGLHDTALIQSIAAAFGVHPLATEDIVAVGGRPLVMEYDGFVFSSLKMLRLEEGAIIAEHVSLLMGPGWVLSFQERPGDVFGGVRQRIRESKARICDRGSDYLWYALMDAVVDNYLLVMEELGTRLEALEGGVWSDNPSNDIPARIQKIREESAIVRGAVKPLREEVDSLLHDPFALINESTHPFLRDLQDHLHHLADALDQIRDSLSSIMDAHLSMLSMRTNEVMKVLTIMASIFIPLTFIAGIYGMNFEHMPELAVPWAYRAVWGVMLAVGVGMVVYFRVKKWI